MRWSVYPANSHLTELQARLLHSTGPLIERQSTNISSTRDLLSRSYMEWGVGELEWRWGENGEYKSRL